MKALNACFAISMAAASMCHAASLETRFSELPMEDRRLTGPLFWLHGDDHETKDRLSFYIDKVAEGGNGCFTAESRPHSDWLGPRWFDDLDICLNRARERNLRMWIFDERWWPSQSIGGKVPPRYAAKSIVAESFDVPIDGPFDQKGFSGERQIGCIAGRMDEQDRFLGETLTDLAPFIRDGRLQWSPPSQGRWKIVKFTHAQAPGLGQTGGRELSIDGASRDCTDWFLKTVYQPHYERFKDDFGKTIPGFFYDEPETRGDWGSEVNPILAEWAVDWKKAYIAYKFRLAGDDDAAARYQYMEAVAEAWGRVMYGGMTKWCEDRGVLSIGHFMEHKDLYRHPQYCAGDMMKLQGYSSMGGIDLVCRQMNPGERPPTIYQTPKLGSSVSHVNGRKDDVAMCEIFGGYNQDLTYPEMKWLTDQHQVRGINFLIPHSFNPKAPHDRDYPPYFYNDGQEPRWPLYRVWADYSSRLSLMLTGGHHVCPAAILFSGNAGRVGSYTTPESLTTSLQDALYDADWLPFDTFENQAEIDAAHIALHQERYRVLVVPPTELIPIATLSKVERFFRQGGIVLGYGRLPSKSGTVGIPSSEIAKLCAKIWGFQPQPSTIACNISPAGGRAYFLPESPDPKMIADTLHNDAGVPPVVEVLEGETNHWLHVLHRVKEGRDVYLICNQDPNQGAKTFRLRFRSEGVPEAWDAMRNEIQSLPYTRVTDGIEIPLTLEPMESVLVVFHESARPLPGRLTAKDMDTATRIEVTGQPVRLAPAPKRDDALTASPVTSRPYSGSFRLPDAVSPSDLRAFLMMEGLSPEEAARVTINGKDAGGCIGRPLRIDVTRHLKAGSNSVEIRPFAPENVHVILMHTAPLTH